MQNQAAKGSFLDKAYAIAMQYFFPFYSIKSLPPMQHFEYDNFRLFDDIYLAVQLPNLLLNLNKKYYCI